jgi:hypothetical protein
MSTHLRLGLPSGIFPSGFLTNILYAFPFSIHARCPAHPFVLDLIILIVLGEEYELRRSSLCSFLQPPVSLFSVQIFSRPCSETPSVYVPPLISEIKFHTHTEPRAKL